MSKRKGKAEVVLNVDIQAAIDKFPFIKNEKVTFLEREEKGALFSVCDATEGCSKYCCFWDRHPIKGAVIKCPIRKVYKGAPQEYSAINGITYEMRDNVNATEFYYETDGNFCSEECLWAFLEEEEVRNPLYENSKQLILALKGSEPRAAPHWRVLAAFGGTLSIEKYREGFKNKDYKLEEITSGYYPICYKFKESYHL